MMFFDLEPAECRHHDDVPELAGHPVLRERRHEVGAERCWTSATPGPGARSWKTGRINRSTATSVGEADERSNVGTAALLSTDD